MIKAIIEAIDQKIVMLYTQIHTHTQKHIL